MPNTVIVFGGSGFIGTHLIRRLVEEGKSSIVAVDVLPPRERLEDVDYRIGDVRDLSSFEFPENVKRIYNFAAVHRTPGHPFQEYYETNVLGALEVTKAAARHDVPEIVFTSSISVYGPDEVTKTETTPLAPVSAYGWSKSIAERIHRQWFEAKADRRLVIARPAAVFGKGECGNFTSLAKLLKQGIFIYPGRKDTIKACIYVEDLLDAIELARGQEAPFVLFNGAYPQRYTLEQIVETFITGHFPKAKTIMVPRSVVTGAAKMLKPFNAFNIGIHPERVMKLVRSTDVYPGWLASMKCDFPDALPRALRRWSEASDGTFE